MLRTIIVWGSIFGPPYSGNYHISFNVDDKHALHRGKSRKKPTTHVRWVHFRTLTGLLLRNLSYCKGETILIAYHIYPVW